MIDSAIITGGGSGIGQAVAIQIAKQGIQVVLIGRKSSNEITHARILSEGGRAMVYTCDLEDYATIRSELPLILAKIKGRRWGVVLAASILGLNGNQSTSEDFERVFRTNVVGNLTVLEAALPIMKNSEFGRVVFFAGGGAAYAYPIFPAYALSKVSTVRLVENLAANYPPVSGLSFVCLAPGAVDTPMLSKVIIAGGEVKTKTLISEPVEFVTTYLNSESNSLSGRYLHVRDNWRSYLDETHVPASNQFFLRRVE